ncbi:methionyl-tRNA formyltransferase [Sanguibacter antarcticus]|nr:methionyl-tRNA formyltransferase [Sanguibacter antarcticus]
MRLLFAGTPAVAVPALEALLDSRHEVVAVLTRADARSGRGRRLAPSPVRERAEEAGIPVITDRPRSEGFVERLAALEVDCAPVVAYGEILPPDVLGVPVHGWVNLHFSLLPAWRGAAPVQRAVMAGDEVTGASTFRIEEGPVDTGPVFGVATETIRRRDTAGVLLDRLARSGAGLLVASLDAIEDGHAAPVVQDVDGVSLAPKLTVEDARVVWSYPAHVVDRRVRGCTPAPGAWTDLPDGSRLGLGPVTVLAEDDAVDVALEPGRVLVTKQRVLVGTGSRPVALGEVTPAGKRPMAASDWARGARLDESVRLGAEGTS